MIVLDKLDEDGMPITESVTTNEEEFEIARDGKYFFRQVFNRFPNLKSIQFKLKTFERERTSVW